MGELAASGVINDGQHSDVVDGDGRLVLQKEVRHVRLRVQPGFGHSRLFVDASLAAHDGANEQQSDTVGHQQTMQPPAPSASIVGGNVSVARNVPPSVPATAATAAATPAFASPVRTAPRTRIA